jgi:hypothetical protein
MPILTAMALIGAFICGFILCASMVELARKPSPMMPERGAVQPQVNVFVTNVLPPPERPRLTLVPMPASATPAGNRRVIEAYEKTVALAVTR